MISRDQAADLLSLIAPTTQAAFTRALASYNAVLEAHTDVQKQMDAAVAAVANGVDFWAVFATCLKNDYAAHPSVERVAGTRSLQYRWMIEKRLLLQLKSNTDNLPVDQPEIPGITEQLGGSIEWIALTWEHNLVERFEPAFVQIQKSKGIWRLPVASLIFDGVDVITPTVPRSTVSSARRVVATQPSAEQS